MPTLTTDGERVASRHDRARALFEFLLRGQELRTRPPVHTNAYERVVWLADVPDHPAAELVDVDRGPDPASPVWTLSRVTRTPAPSPPHAVQPWVDFAWPESESIARLAERLPWSAVGRFAGAESDTPDIGLEELPETERQCRGWLERWQEWAGQDRILSRLQDLYKQLFDSYTRAANRPDEYELVLGVACLSGQTETGVPVQRHLLTAPVQISLDERTGVLRVVPEPGPEALTLELDMLAPSQIPRSMDVRALRDQAQAYAASPVDRREIGPLARALASQLDPDGRYSDDLARPGAVSTAHVQFAPAVVLRRRIGHGLLEVFGTILDQLNATDEVPAGLLPLVDPGQTPPSPPDRTPGGIVAIDGEPFLALPLNERQRRVVESVDARAQTMVQGPPGTGKTHIAAALLTHLLAQGKRVLVTAQTDRALAEVRAQLPESIRSLVVNVASGKRNDLGDLRTAVDRLARETTDWDELWADRKVEVVLGDIDRLGRRRAALHRSLLESKQREVSPLDHRGYRGTLADLAKAFQHQKKEYGWLLAYAQPSSRSRAPVSDAELIEWHALLTDAELTDAAGTEATRTLVPRDEIPEPTALAESIVAESRALDQVRRYADLAGHAAAVPINHLGPADRDFVREATRDLARRATELDVSPDSWMGDALRDVRIGRSATWKARAEALDRLLAEVGPQLTGLRRTTAVTVEGDRAALLRMAGVVRDHVRAHGPIRALPSGEPRVTMLSPRVVKDARALFAGVRVNGLPPLTEEALDQLLHWGEAVERLDAMDRAWAAYVEVPPEKTPEERLAWHHNEAEHLHRILALDSDLGRTETRFRALGLPRPDWTDPREIAAYARLTEAATAREAAADWSARLDQLAHQLRLTVSSRDCADAVGGLLTGVETRDPRAYHAAYDRLTQLWRCRQRLEHRQTLHSRLAAGAPELAAAIQAAPTDVMWRSRCRMFTAAWDWAATGAWILEQERLDVNDVQGQLRRIEQQIRDQVSELASLRAWSAAVARLTGAARADLTQYTQLVRRLGKGTGRYAAVQRAEIRTALARCSRSVPIWVMPLYRIAEQLKIERDMFDVVIVDEASQAGTEAVFLQYLAPKIVVIGDDKQVSPSAVGADRQQLRDLADQYLREDRYVASWQDPERSLFDEAKMRYGNVITLVEHHRCVPEIIGFSNRVAYEPDGIRLVPVRQFGADRIDPIKMVHVADGFEQGFPGNKTNPAEAEAVVRAIQRCLSDARYDGLSFGVISLLGRAQAQLIQNLLVDRIGPEAMAARDLRCGDAADFQGAERHVMFLSLVAAPREARLAALTRDLYLQRFNVATSRAKDQLWVLHSIALSDLGNPEDMRHLLLDYGYAELERAGEVDSVGPSRPVSEDERVPPFTSLLQQRVHNRLVERGYRVVPEYDVAGFPIDLVVVGARSRMAVVCDGDHWQGPGQYAEDLRRQRDLEGAGWRFFRVRESAMYVDQAGTMRALTEALARQGILPLDRPRSADPRLDQAPASVREVRHGYRQSLHRHH